MAAIAATKSLEAKYIRYVDQRTGDISVSYSQRIKHYRDLYRSLQAKLTLECYAGGISESDKEIDEEDTDRVEPAFAIGQMDYE
jgi:hypothetical protein